MVGDTITRECGDRMKPESSQTEEPNPRTVRLVRLSGFGSFRRNIMMRNAIQFYVSVMAVVSDIDHASI